MVVGFPNLNHNGRLGNQLYCLAATIGIAKSHGMDYGFPKWSYQNCFTKPLPFYNGDYRLMWRESRFEYHKPEINTNFNTSLHGDLYSFRSYRYWIDHKEEVLSYLQFTEEIKLSAQKKIIGGHNGLHNCVAIHVRRGDYLNLPNHHPVLSIEYYKKALSNFPGKDFIVFSDDIEWCRNNFVGNMFSYSIGNEVEDLFLMSQCSSIICANSSFSEWAAIIGQVDNVIVPKMQFGSAYNHNTDDMHLPTWKKM